MSEIIDRNSMKILSIYVHVEID